MANYLARAIHLLRRRRTPVIAPTIVESDAPVTPDAAPWWLDTRFADREWARQVIEENRADT